MTTYCEFCNTKDIETPVFKNNVTDCMEYFCCHPCRVLIVRQQAKDWISKLPSKEAKYYKRILNLR